MAGRETLLEDWFDVWSYDMSFFFKFVRQSSGEIRTYILHQPPYRPGQATDAHTTHRYGLSAGKPYICYEPMPRNMDDAKVIAREWAKRTAYYIKYDKWFQKGELS